MKQTGGSIFVKAWCLPQNFQSSHIFVCQEGHVIVKRLWAANNKYWDQQSLHTFINYFNNSGTVCQKNKHKKLIVVPLCVQMNWEIVMHWHSIHDVPWRSNKKLIDLSFIFMYKHLCWLSFLQLFTLCTLEKHLCYWLSSELCE